jgi:hypothetical protein
MQLTPRVLQRMRCGDERHQPFYNGEIDIVLNTAGEARVQSSTVGAAFAPGRPTIAVRAMGASGTATMEVEVRSICLPLCAFGAVHGQQQWGSSSRTCSSTVQDTRSAWRQAWAHAQQQLAAI